MRISAFLLLIAVPCALAAQAPQPLDVARGRPEATSLFGKPLVSAEPAGETKVRLDVDLAKAKADYDRDPASADAAIWLGRRLAYLGRYRDAIDAFTQGIAKHPNEARLYRHTVIATSRSVRLLSPSAICVARRSSWRGSRTKSSRTAPPIKQGSRGAPCSRTSGITSGSRSTCPATSRARWPAIARG